MPRPERRLKIKTKNIFKNSEVFSFLPKTRLGKSRQMGVDDEKTLECKARQVSASGRRGRKISIEVGRLSVNPPSVCLQNSLAVSIFFPTSVNYSQPASQSAPASLACEDLLETVVPPLLPLLVLVPENIREKLSHPYQLSILLL